MKKTYIKYNNRYYSINYCTFFKDCIEYHYFDNHSEETIIIPINEYELIEEPVIINDLTKKEYDTLEFEKNKKIQEKIQQLTIEFENRNEYKLLTFPYQSEISGMNDDEYNDFNYDLCDLNLFLDNDNRITEIPNMSSYKFFNLEKYKSYYFNNKKYYIELNKYIEQNL